MDLNLGHVSLDLLNNFTTVVHHQPEQHFDQYKVGPLMATFKAELQDY